MEENERREDNGKEEEQEILIRCPECGVQNKLKSLKLGQSPKCGKCGAVLIDMTELPPDSDGSA